MTPEIREAIQLSMRFHRERMEQEEEVMGHIYSYHQDGLHLFALANDCFANDAAKDSILSVILGELFDAKAKMVVFVSDVWTMKVRKPEDALTMPADSPIREEALMVVGYQLGQANVLVCQKYSRDKKGKRKFGETIWHSDVDYGVRGRFYPDLRPSDLSYALSTSRYSAYDPMTDVGKAARK